MSGKTDFQESSGNVFADLGVVNPDEHLAKAQLASRINDIIDALGLTQGEVAKLLGVDQPKVSVLVRGRLAGFSLDRLFGFLNALHYNVQIVIKRKPRPQPAHTFVVSERKLQTYSPSSALQAAAMTASDR
ncbi:MAG: XRE family transcriptional regulator [Nitrospirae bacterium]|nr:XRE family transcriptional regulator [Magnetococcales bacterium]HAT50259.1 transcriptional regulator [Alphaproteobacteria bacterium]